MQLTIEHLQTLVFRAREHLAENLICAGGAPADLRWGKQPKDIDLFVQLRAEDLAACGDDDLGGGSEEPALDECSS